MSTREAILGGGTPRPRPPEPEARRSRRRGERERGAVAVEAAFILSVVLIPLLLGVITFGMYFWRAQSAQPLASRLPLVNIVGTFNCAELIDRIKTTVQNALPSVTGLIDGVLPLEDIGVQVIEVLPTVGVVVEVSITVQGAGALGGLVPLPNGGALVSEATYRLENIKLTTAGC